MSTKPKAREHQKLFKPALAAVLTVLCGLTLWALPAGESWRRASYDYLFLFGTRAATNPPVVIISVDENSYQAAGRTRQDGWDRSRHARFLDRLVADGCALVVFDFFFDEAGEQPEATRALVEAMRRCSNVVLTANHTNDFHRREARMPVAAVQRPVPLWPDFHEAVRGTNWGVGTLNVDDDGVVRQHWRYPSPGLYDSVAWIAARRAGASLSDEPQARWVRYYAPGWAWASLSYVEAESEPANFFRGKIVFIGNKPKDDLDNGDPDEFLTPFSHWEERKKTVAGVEILATEFLNLWNHEWLRRAPPWLEWLVLMITGVPLGMLANMRRVPAGLVAVGVALLVLIAGVCLSYFSDFWFPWLIVAGGQVPLALAFALIRREPALATRVSTVMIPVVGNPASPVPAVEAPVEVPDYELIEPPFGKGAYGQVWLARNAVGQWQAIKMIFRAKFDGDLSPYEREFRGIERYKRVADKHPGLLRIDFVSRMKPQGYFYYAMELGDAVMPGWETKPASYKPLDLAAKCAANGGRLPARECVRIALKLCEPLQFLHEQGLAHRDIKPRNIIFLEGQPKLADVGLVADSHRPVQDISLVGTPGFMPPEPEPPGTPQADIYGLGMMLYVISTGSKPAAFPELSTTLVDRNRFPEFSRLSTIIFKACHHDRNVRYGSVTEMHAALMELDAALAREFTRPGL